MTQVRRPALWGRWVAANSLAELVGLGTTFLLGATLFAGIAAAEGTAAALLTALLMTVTGAFEGLIVGLAQWSVLRRALPSVGRRAWVGATIAGAVFAWLLGSTAMLFGGMSSGAATGPAAGQPQEPPAALMLVLAAALGLAAGLALSAAQGWVLRRHVAGAWRWLPANALAWAAGMPLIFAGVDLAQKAGSPARAALSMALAIALAGAVVGAIHGIALVSFLPRRRGLRVPAGV
jgi:hypothetical protein